MAFGGNEVAAYLFPWPVKMCSQAVPAGIGGWGPAWIGGCLRRLL